jgi:ribosomal protein S6E (S10)
MMVLGIVYVADPPLCAKLTANDSVCQASLGALPGARIGTDPEPAGARIGTDPAGAHIGTDPAWARIQVGGGTDPAGPHWHGPGTGAGRQRSALARTRQARIGTYSDPAGASICTNPAEARIGTDPAGASIGTDPTGAHIGTDPAGPHRHGPGT